MKHYLAPLEGITGYIFRNALKEFFGEGIDKYYAPFLVPCTKRALSQKEINEISPDNNSRYELVPQILTIDADDFTRVKLFLRNMGYEEVNLNLGCPSRTVASKKRGAGALEDTEALDRFLDGVFKDGDRDISIKTRIGIESESEFEDILEVYGRYPIKELIIHPRVLKEYYKGKPHRDTFYGTLEKYTGNICYNGDIFSVEDERNLLTECGGDDRINAVMIGRGALKNPSLFRELAGGAKAGNEEIAGFLTKLRNDYSNAMSGQTPVLYKMKEIWSYLGDNYPQSEKQVKKLLKCKSLEEYKVYERQILANKS